MGTGEAGREEKADDRANVLKSWGVKFGIPLAFVAVMIGVYIVSQFFTSFGKKEEQPQPVNQPTIQAPVTVKTKLMFVDSSVWRYAGTITSDRKYAVIDSVRGSRLIPFVHCRAVNLEVEWLFNGEKITRFTGTLVPDQPGLPTEPFSVITAGSI